MKHILSLFLFFTFRLTVFCQSDSIKLEKIIFPKTTLQVYYINENPKFINGKLYNGSDTSLLDFENENILAVEKYQDGIKIELKTFYDNMQPECHFEWKNGKRDGISKKWFKSGKIRFDNTMKEGQEIGTNIMYFENGNPDIINDSKAGINMQFYENGKLKMLIKYINDSAKCGGMNGYEETRWGEDGQLKLKTVENCGKQTFRYYYNDSTIESEGTQIDLGLFLVGKYTKYYKNGQVKFKGQYKDGENQTEANIKIGTWKYFNESSQLVREDYYENNELKKSKIYNKEKKVKKTEFNK